MFLSAQQITTAIKNGEIGITPFLEQNIKPASYTFTLAETIFEFEEQNELTIETKPRLRKVQIPEDGYLLQPHTFILGSACEHLQLNGNYLCILSTRGSCAQIGLNVLQSSLIAEPDTNNPQKLELYNANNLPVRLTKNMPLVKGIFASIQ